MTLQGDSAHYSFKEIKYQTTAHLLEKKKQQYCFLKETVVLKFIGQRMLDWGPENLGSKLISTINEFCELLQVSVLPGTI